MASNPVQRKWTVEEYLAYEARTGIKFQYIKGKLQPLMTPRDIIRMNVLDILRRQSQRNTDCTVYSQDMRLKINESIYLYPDASVVYGNPSFADKGETSLANPTLVVEILPLAGYVNGFFDKFDAYFELETVQLVLLLHSDEVFATPYSRVERGWLLSDYKNLDDVVPLEAIGCSLPLSEAYLNIDFETDETS